MNPSIDTRAGLVERLRQAAANIFNARQTGIAGYLAGWEHLAISEAADLLATLNNEAMVQAAVDQWAKDSASTFARELAGVRSAMISAAQVRDTAA